MTYVFKIFTAEAEEVNESIVQSIYNRERDLHWHMQTLERYKEILKDKNFEWRVFPNGTTFRQKIENEIPVLEWAIKECEKLIQTSEKYLPVKAKIKETVAKIKAKENPLLSETK